MKKEIDEEVKECIKEWLQDMINKEAKQ